ncbi:uncharacterized protein LOC130815040 isoform X3 [Amaranthus tricolor]|uniref:uncharacterized protein LOC130815040 isoform X3 n=1 Tax=Amaranthus tricolor TaxID=29722 RepID=UPI002588997A|nr:uncharacterized protein LOC130815040 isoform X3 [Amaranthus tricolor]
MSFCRAICMGLKNLKGWGQHKHLRCMAWLKLVQSVLSSTSVYWSHVFTLPRSIQSVLSGGSTSQPEEVKRLPGGKVKKKDKKEVIIEKMVRNKRKCITTVKGLELFGVKLSDASKKLGKKFATGASVVKGPTEKEQIDVQGDIAYDIVEFITDTWPDVPETAIFFIEEGKKVPAA